MQPASSRQSHRELRGRDRPLPLLTDQSSAHVTRQKGTTYMQRGGFRAPGLSRMASGLALLLVALWAAPAISHAIFPLRQNPSGTRTNPYPAGTVQNLMMNVPEERGENPTSTVDVKVELPPGWTNPVCQSALKVSGIDPG